MTTANVALNPAVEIVRAKQAVKILRAFFDGAIVPYYRAKRDKLPKEPKYWTIKEGYFADEARVLAAIQTIEAEIESL